MTRIDSHQHFWRYDPTEYEWITPDKASLRRDYLPADLRPLLAASGFDGSIAVQARQTIEETDWLLQLAAEHTYIKGVVGWCDIRSKDLGHQLDKYAENSKLVGLRHVVSGEPDDKFMLGPEFRAGIARLSDYDLAYDLLIFARHLPVAARLVREFPGQVFVLDHLANPQIRQKELAPWARELGELARFPNVSCKLSGMTTQAEWGHWKDDDFRVYLDIAFEAFGPNRLMVGTDWPVCTLSSGYAETLDVVNRYIQRFPAEIKAGILGRNCAQIYGIEE